MARAKEQQPSSEPKATPVATTATGRADAAANDKMRIWDQVCMTDPRYTKDFKRSGGFEGTAINPAWQCMRATELFGPIGKGWGWTIVQETQMDDFVGQSRIWFCKLRVWYTLDGQRYETPEQWGATEIMGKYSTGRTFFDEEAPKKSVTDALSKCLSYLGFAADVHMGLYDDNKYVADARRHYEEQDKAGARAHGAAINSGGKGNAVDKADEGLAEWRDKLVASIKKETDLQNLQALWAQQQPVGKAYAEKDAAGKQAYNFVVSQMKRRVVELKQDAAGEQTGKGESQQAAE